MKHHCQRFRKTPISRRQLLTTAATGFGATALTAMLHQANAAEQLKPPTGTGRLETGPFVLRKPHHPAKAKSVIFLYMDGGPSHVDTFDPKPQLTKDSGKPFRMKIEPTQFSNNGNTLGSPWKFKKYGKSGIPVSDLFPNVAQNIDDIAVIRSMTSDFSEHTNANYFLHTGSGLQGRPSMGAWVTYGLGTPCKNLPGFVVINCGLIPPGGLDNFNSGFLPATYQGSVFKPSNPPVANIRRTERTTKQQANKLALMNKLDAAGLKRIGEHNNVESAIANYELAAKMQLAVPDVMDLASEPAYIRETYGLNAKWRGTQQFGAGCLAARRMVERGVRFIEITCPGGSGDRWDQHGGLRDGHTKNARSVDQPIGALLKDLKQRGMLDETLVVWTGEFGRTPFAQGRNGRDHNPFGFSSWMAGGGIKGGTTFGATDEYGYKAVQNPIQMHDFHATMLHLLGVDHTRSTFRFSGRDMRLTDVHGHVIKEICA